MEAKKEYVMGSKKITGCMLAVYLLVLVWIILFKMELSPASLPHMRSMNLIPFGDSVIVNGKIQFGEITGNLLAFVPFGVFMGMLWEEKSFLKKTAPIFLASLALETLQFAFAVGASDITDLLMNTAGGALGAGCVSVLSKLFKSRTNQILNLVCLAGMVFLLLLIGILIVANL